MTISCEGYVFSTKGKTVVQEGWKAVEQRFKAALKSKENDEPENMLPAVSEGDVLDAVSASVTEHYLRCSGDAERSPYSDMKYFTAEEINLMCCFNTSSRKRLIDDIESVTLNNKDSEIAELIHKTVQKLEAMSDAEFDALYIAPDSMMDD